MLTQLYKNFLKDKNEYKNAEMYWEKLFQEIFSQTNIESYKRLKYSFSNGEEFLDGNPITDRYFPKSKKAIRIIQQEITTNSIKLDAWIGKLEIEEGIEILELVISLELSEESAEIVKRLVDEWIIKDLNKEEMEIFRDRDVYQKVA